MERTITIYALVNSLNGQIFYVGQTKSVKTRLYAHRCLMKSKDNMKKYEYIKDMYSKNGTVLMLELFTTKDKEEANKKETEYIKQYPNLVNMIESQIPSRSGTIANNETRKKMFDSSPKKKRVAMIKDNKIVRVFDGVRQANRETKIDHRSISAVASGSEIRKTAGGFNWKYI